MSKKLIDEATVKLVLNKAFQLGQRYWSWADSEYSSHWKKADAAKAEFDQLVQDTINAALTEQPAQQCKWPTCQSEEAQQALAEQIKRELVGEQPTQQEPVALGPLAKRRVFDYIRGAYDLGYNDARNEKATPGDSAPGYKGRDVEADHGSALFHALEAITSPPAQRKPLTGEQVTDGCRSLGVGAYQTLGAAFEAGVRFAEAAHGIKGNA